MIIIKCNISTEWDYLRIWDNKVQYLPWHYFVLDFLCSGPIVAATTWFIRCLPGHSDGVIENVWSRKTLNTAVENYYIELKENYIRYYQFARKMLGKWTIIILYDWIVGYFKQRHTEICDRISVKKIKKWSQMFFAPRALH